MTVASSFGRVRTLGEDLRAGRQTARRLVERALARIEAVDSDVQAWITVQGNDALHAADALDAEAAEGHYRGPLHGLPFAVKDVIDVAGLPTRANSPARDGAAPAELDATVVSRLRAAGAIMLGKVHTTEFAYFESAPPTRNPHDLARTPGGSSGGSAAAVASGTVPIALGTQTAGSVSRPAAFCGVGAFKPSTLSIGGGGVTPLAPTFDTVGVFADTAADAASVAAVFAPEASGIGAAPPCVPAELDLVVIDDPLIEALAEPAMRGGVAELGEQLAMGGVPVRRVAAPVPLADVLAVHRTILLAELGRVHGGLLMHEALVAPRLAADIRAGRMITPAEHLAALATLIDMRRRFWAALPWPSLVLMPAAPGPAPLGEATGDPSFVSPMTALAGPLASIPCGTTDGAPLGAMLGAAPGEDARLAAALAALDQ